MSRRATRLLIAVLLLFPTLSSAEEGYWEYNFRPGDSIWKIAQEYTDSVNNWSEIQRINEIRQGKDRKIRPGTRIVIPLSMLKQQPAPAIITAIDGAVIVTRADGQVTTARIGTRLYSGDRIKTDDSQSLRLQFADRSELSINRNSEVVLDRLSQHQQTGMVDTSIRLNDGSVDTRVEKQHPDSSYQIKTPAAITAVRGTEFRMSTDEAQVSRTEVTEGVVAVSAGDSEVAVEQGYGIVAESGKPLADPVKLLTAPEISASQVDGQSSVSITVSVLDGASAYRYRVATDEEFNMIYFDERESSSSIIIDDMEPGEYHLRVRGIDSYGLEGVDSTTSFIIEEPPEQEDSVWIYFLAWAVLIVLL